jgi:carbon storage regulator
MLVLTRKVGQQIRIGDQIVLTIVRTQGQNVRVGIQAPRSVSIVRGELAPLAGSQGSTSAGRPDARRPLEASGDTGDVPVAVGPRGRDAINGVRCPKSSHPHRWTVSSMRERLPSVASHRPLSPTARPLQGV